MGCLWVGVWGVCIGVCVGGCVCVKKIQNLYKSLMLPVGTMFVLMLKNNFHPVFRLIPNMKMQVFFFSLNLN